MKTHVESAHSKLVLFKELAIVEELVDVNQSQQLGNK